MKEWITVTFLTLNPRKLTISHQELQKRTNLEQTIRRYLKLGGNIGLMEKGRHRGKKKELRKAFLCSSISKESTCNVGVSLQCRRPRFNPWVGKIPWRRKWQPTPVFLPRESHGQKSLAGCSPWGRKSQTWLSYWTTTTRKAFSSYDAQDTRPSPFK